MTNAPVFRANGEFPKGQESGETEVVEGDSFQQATRKTWHSAAIIHYAGQGLWTLALAPAGSEQRWQWLVGITADELMQALSGHKNALVRCPTDTVKEILRNVP